jgi:hypothetical protein
VLQPFEFCNPVDRDGGGIPEPEAHLTCYDLSEQTPALPTVVVSTQFGEDTVSLGLTHSLCVPAIKTAVDGVETGVELPLAELQGRLNHFKCYERAKRAPKGTEAVVLLEDQFDPDTPISTEVKEGPFLVCNAVNKNGEDIVNSPAAQHLACFKIKDEAGQRKPSIITVNAEDQFNAVELDLGAGGLLCVPATVRVSP